jgi:hypothetical protein
MVTLVALVVLHPARLSDFGNKAENLTTGFCDY